MVARGGVSRQSRSACAAALAMTAATATAFASGAAATAKSVSGPSAFAAVPLPLQNSHPSLLSLSSPPSRRHGRAYVPRMAMDAGDTGFGGFGAMFGFGKNKENDDIVSEKDGNKKKVMSVEDVDADLSYEIQGALSMAESDLGEQLSPASNWDDMKDSLYGKADELKNIFGGGGGTAAGGVEARLPPRPPADPPPRSKFLNDSPGELRMRQYESIDATAGIVGEEVGSDNANMLDRQLQLEEQVQETLSEASAGRISQGENDDADVIDAELSDGGSEPDGDGEEEKEEEDDADLIAAEIASMSEAYTAALDAANDRVDLLTEEIDILESELIDARTALDNQTEKWERSSIELAFMSKNYSELKKVSEAKDGRVPELEERVETYAALVSKLEKGRDDAGAKLAEATDEASKWREERDRIEADMKGAASETDEGIVAMEDKLKEMDNTVESARKEERDAANAALAGANKQSGIQIAIKAKTISATRRALRKARSETRAVLREAIGSDVGERIRNEDAAAAVKKAREVAEVNIAELRADVKKKEEALRVRDEALEKAQAGLEEKETLAGDVTNLHKLLDEAQSEVTSNAEGYKNTVLNFKEEEERLVRDINEIGDAIEAFKEGREKDVAVIELMNSEIEKVEKALAKANEALDSELEKAKGTEEANVDLTTQLEALQGRLDGTMSASSNQDQKAADQISVLNDDLSTKQKLVDATQAALRETEAGLKGSSERVNAEKARAEGLEEALTDARTKLREFEVSGAEEVEEAARQSEHLQAEINRLNQLFEEASEKAAGDGERVGVYQGRIDTITRRLIMSERYMNEKQAELAKLKRSLSDANVVQKATEEANDENLQMTKELERAKRELQETLEGKLDELQKSNAALETAKANCLQLTEELEQLKKGMQHSLAKAGQEIQVKNKDLQTKMDQLQDYDAEVKKKSAELEKMRHETENTLAKAMEETESKADALASKIELDASLKAATGQLALSNAALLNAQAELEGLMREKEASLLKSQEEAAQKDKVLESKIDELRASKAAVEEAQKELGQFQVEVQQSQARADEEAKLKHEALDSKHVVETDLQSKETQLDKLNVEKNTQLDQLKREMNDFAAKADEEVNMKSREIQLLQKTNAAAMKAVEGSGDLKSRLEQLQHDMQETLAKVNEEIRLKNEALMSSENLASSLKAKDGELQRSGLAVANAGAELEQLKSDIEQYRAKVNEGSRQMNEALKKKSDDLQASNAALKKASEDSEKLKNEIQKTVAAVNEENQRKSQALMSKTDFDSALKVKDEQLQQSNVVMKKATNLSQNLTFELDKLKREIQAFSAEAAQGNQKMNTLLRSKTDELQTSNAALQQARIESAKLKAELKNYIESQHKMQEWLAKANEEILKKNKVLKSKESLDALLKASDVELQKSNAAVEKATDELKKSDTAFKRSRNESIELRTELEKMKKETTNYLSNANEEVRMKTGVLQKAQQNIVNLEKEIRLRNEALENKNDIQSALRTKLDQLQSDMLTTLTKSDEAVRSKVNDLQKMDALVSSLMAEISLLKSDPSRSVGQSIAPLSNGAGAEVKQRNFQLPNEQSSGRHFTLRDLAPKKKRVAAAFTRNIYSNDKKQYEVPPKTVKKKDEAVAKAATEAAPVFLKESNLDPNAVHHPEESTEDPKEVVQPVQKSEESQNDELSKDLIPDKDGAKTSRVQVIGDSITGYSTPLSKIVRERVPMHTKSPNERYSNYSSQERGGSLLSRLARR